MQKTVESKSSEQYIKDLSSGVFVKEEGWTPNYIKMGNKN